MTNFSVLSSILQKEIFYAFNLEIGELSSIGGLKILLKEQEMIEFKSCHGNRFRIISVDGNNYIGPKFPLPADSTKPLPGTLSVGLGIRFIEYFVPKGGSVLEWIAKTYEQVLGAKVRVSNNTEEIEVMLGIQKNPQFIRFVEKEEVHAYEGDHLAIYVNDFFGMCNRARNVKIGGSNPKTVSIVWNNPCLTMNYDTLENVERLNEFRIKDFLNFDTGEVVYQLEHEIRSLAHPGFQINKETFL